MESIGFLKSELENCDKASRLRTKVSQLADQTDGVNEKLESQEAIWVQKTKESQSATLTAHPDLAQSVSSATDLDISPTDDTAKQAAKQAKQEQIATQLGTTTAELQKKIDNSQYQQANLSIGQLLSFLQTEQALYTNGISEDAFLGDVVKIRNDLQITEPPIPMGGGVPAELPAHQLTQLSTEQIAQHSGLNTYAQINEMETDYFANKSIQKKHFQINKKS